MKDGKQKDETRTYNTPWWSHATSATPMCSTTTNPRLVRPIEDSVDAVEQIGIATDLLLLLFSELRSLAGNSTDLARAMSNCESALCDRL
jgi:hypothetical protein